MWWRVALATAAGILLALSSPLSLPALKLPFALGTFDFFIGSTDISKGMVQFSFCAFFALLPLFLALRGSRRPAHGFWLGYITGVAWLIPSFIWLISFGVAPPLLLALYFALPVGAFGYLAWWLFNSALGAASPARILWGLPLAWTAIEYLRTFGFWAFPWNLLGYTQARIPWLIQTADIGGVYLVSFLIVLSNAVLAILLCRPARVLLEQQLPRQPWKAGTLLSAGSAILLLVGALAYGAWRLDWIRLPHLLETAQAADARKRPRPLPARNLPAPRPLDLIMVQGGVNSRESWSTGRLFDHVYDAYVPMTESAINDWKSARRHEKSSASRLSEPAESPSQAIAPPWEIGSEDSEQLGQAIARDPEHVARPRGGDIEGPRKFSDVNPALSSVKGLKPGSPPRVSMPRVTASSPGDHDLLMVWPESVLPLYIDPQRLSALPAEYAQQLRNIKNLPKRVPGSAMLFGSIGEPFAPERPENGCILLTSEGIITWPHSKVRLVPFGEVLPMRGVVRFLQFPWSDHDIAEGRKASIVGWRGHKLGPLICFDNVFPFLTRAQAKAGAQAFVLMTNNSWYNLVSGVRQHGDIDIFRVVENRRPLARVSTTGESHVINAQGVVLQRTPAASAGEITAELPSGSETTPYQAVGDLFSQLVLLASLALFLPGIILRRGESFL